ncbi:hypothetical protein [Parvularcula sp. LCG005]|uniref:hypothetical protein n=1 Tax=Parvularcula sp. LCG005 TaxID=3078805 RepID=UPI002942D818|nr:hypothetical protein [Parvularcula sp. LCG005]WOI54744.1 hypothetical protein RUI03_06995 [Parvularcula sp. LCG005]
MVTCSEILKAARLGACVTGLCVPFGAMAMAQDAPEGQTQDTEITDDVDVDTDVITVTASRPRGMVVGDIEPDVTLDSEEIESYGVSSLAELLDELTAETGSGRGRGGGRPVVLLNGQRISGFREIGEYPPEALARVEVLPEEVALKYGYRADQRVINFVLKPNVSVLAVELESERPTAGQRVVNEASIRRLYVNEDRRWSVDAKLVDRTSLLESERDVVSDSQGTPFAIGGNIGTSPYGGAINGALGLAGDDILVAGQTGGGATPALSDFAAGTANRTDTGQYRTLSPAQQEAQIGFSYNRPFFGERASTLSGRLERTETQSRSGLPQATVLIPQGNPFSPFDDDVALYTYADELGPLTRISESLVSNVGFSVVGKPGPWNWTWTGSATQTDSESETDTVLQLATLQAAIDAGSDSVSPFGDLSGQALQQRKTESTSRVAETAITTSGTLMDLPAGPVSSTLKGSVQRQTQDSRSVDQNGETDVSLSRDTMDAQANVDVPLLSADTDDGSFLGDVSANANIAYTSLSDFDDLVTYGGGLTWRPVDALRFIVSVTQEEGAPSISNLSDPLQVTPNVRVFDYTNGETVFVTTIDGGSADLLADNRRVYKIGANIEPFEEQDISIRFDYTDSEIENEVSSFPNATPAIEAAFPDRFVRDETGALLSVDRRPVNLASRTSRELRTTLSYMKRLERPESGGNRGPGGGAGGRPSGGQRSEASAEERPQAQRPGNVEGAAQGERPRGRPPGAPPAGDAPPPQDGQKPAAEGERPSGPPSGGRAGRGGGRGGPPGGGRPGGYRVSLSHVWSIEKTVQIAPGLPVLDLLEGDTLGGSGGEPEHTLDLGFNLWNNGLFMRSGVKWQSATTVNASPLSTVGDLEFSDLTTAEIRVGYNLDTKAGLVAKYPWVKGMRVSFDVENIFDTRQKVTDASGDVPLTYQPDLIDPIGRTIEFEIRKRF